MIKSLRKIASRVALRVRVARRHKAKQVTTDTAQIYAIAPEQLKTLVEEGGWLKTYRADPSDKKSEQLIEEHGGAVFNTGTDGSLEVQVPAEEEAQASRTKHKQ